MSDEHRITKVEKEKDPRRVEAGKKLGALSRAAKERKAAERSERAHAENGDTDNSGPSYMSVVAGVGVATGLICLYFTYRQDKRVSEAGAGWTGWTGWTGGPTKSAETEVSKEQPEPEPEPKQVSSKLRSFDD